MATSTSRSIASQHGDGWTVEIFETKTSRGVVTYWVHSVRGDEHSYYTADQYDLAKAISDTAIQVQLAWRVPDLQAIARDLKARHHKAASTQRRAFGGAVLLGDTAPDELPPAA